MSGLAEVCPLCWFSFATPDELAEHVEMENAVDWPLDGLERAVQGQARATRSDDQFGTLDG